MPSFIPVEITRPKPYLLQVRWEDGSTATITLERLREECPCALCKGETIMGTTYFVGIKQFSPGMNELVSLVPVGNYGLQATWKDGHDAGIYTWENFRNAVLGNALTAAEIADLEHRENQGS